MTGRHYPSPAAFRRALTDRLRTAASTGPWTLAQLQRQFAYDRLLQRLYQHDPSWVVKGATALLARDIGVRATIDVDVYRNTTTDLAEAELRAAVAVDLHDWFRFEVGPPQPVGTGTPGLRLPITAYLGTTSWASFHVDLVGSELRMTGQPDQVRPLAFVHMPDIAQHPYAVYPLVDHIADKIVAVFQRYGPTRASSTRYKDLVDLVAIVTQASVDAEHQLAALRSEARRRGITLPSTFVVPDPTTWQSGYAAEARRTLLTAGRTLDDALTIVTPFTDPLLDGTAHGRWDPQLHTWTR